MMSADQYMALQQLYATYACSLNESRYDAWLGLFAKECSYMLQPRENFDRGLPLATMALESRGMLEDRVYASTNTLFHAPYYQRHMFGPALVLEQNPDQLSWLVQCHYTVFRTRPGSVAEVFSVGQCRDTIISEAGELKFARKHVIFDSEMVLNSVIYPI
jgi:salicylate 5-hydroxylase small subunit